MGVGNVVGRWREMMEEEDEEEGKGGRGTR